MRKIGPLTIIEGANHSKVPYSRSIYIESGKTLIDTGAKKELLEKVDKDFGIDVIFNTHYHPDHMKYNYLFKAAKTLLNPIEYNSCRTIEGISIQNGIYEEWGIEGFEKWKNSIPNSWLQGLQQINGAYEYHKVYQCGNEKVLFIHTPGHTQGFCCPYFPDLGIVYTGDYDMTSFGPWYNGSDGSIDNFILSGQKLLSLDVDTYITGHQKGIFSKKSFHNEMDKYLSIIDKRDEIIVKYIRQGLTFDELASIGIFYPKEALENKMLHTWERIGIRKHLKRLGYSNMI